MELFEELTGGGGHDSHPLSDDDLPSEEDDDDDDDDDELDTTDITHVKVFFLLSLIFCESIIYL